MILKLFTGKLRALTILSSSAVSVASVSTSSVLSSDTRSSAIGVLSTTVDTIVGQASTLTDTYIVDPSKKVGTGYKDFFTGVKDGVDIDKIKKVGEGYKDFGTKTVELAKKYAVVEEGGKSDDKLITKDNLEKLNYYLFQYSTIASEVLKQALSIPTDSLANVVKNQSGKSTAGLISAQKINEMVKSQEGKAMLGSLVMLYTNFKTYIEKIKGEQVHDAIKIIFSPEEGRMKEVLQTLTTNISSLSSKNTSNVGSVDEFVKQLLLGENPENKIKSGASEAKTLVESKDVEDLLNGLGDIKEMLEPLKAVLGTMSQSGSEGAEDQD